jgi:hypothetical protein
MEVLSYELARQTGADSRSIDVALHDDGSIRLDGLDMGPMVEQTWGGDDYEFWVTIPPEAVGRLAVELLRQRYMGDLGAVEALSEFCAELGIDHQSGSWT